MLRVLNICDTSIAFIFQRQSEKINSYLGEKAWRYYHDQYKPPGNQHFIDLSPMSEREEVYSVLEQSDLLVYHATRNFRRTLWCRDGFIKKEDYPKGLEEVVVIHGSPETENIDTTNHFIGEHGARVRFFVDTPNQLSVFRDTELFPIVGLFSGDDPTYSPREGYLSRSGEVRVVRRSIWKATDALKVVLRSAGATPRVYHPLRYFTLWVAHRVLGHRRPGMYAEKVFRSQNRGTDFAVDNRTYWQDIMDVLSDIKAADILLENDIADYVGGGCNHTIGVEAISMGVAVFNAMTKKNSEYLTRWLEADCLPPFPNWESVKHYRNGWKAYLRRLLHDHDFRCQVKSQSRAFFEQWIDAPLVIPKIVAQLAGETRRLG